MKKLILIIFISLLLFGCSLNNTPTSKVDELMNKYQMLDNDINEEIEEVLSEDTLTLEQKNKYKDLIKKQYTNLQYEIKDEKIDGDKAIVTTSIKVLDYKNTIKKLDNDYINKLNYNEEEYNNEKIKRLEQVMDKVTYTIEIDLIKDDTGTWKIQKLSNVDKKKIQGMY